MDNIPIFAALLISLIAHEASHALALQTIGAPIRTIQFGTPALYRLVTLGRQVPYQLQVAWSVAGWTLITVVSFWQSR